jgi:hypothetical protein
VNFSSLLPDNFPAGITPDINTARVLPK